MSSVVDEPLLSLSKQVLPNKRHYGDGGTVTAAMIPSMAPGAKTQGCILDFLMLAGLCGECNVPVPVGGAGIHAPPAPHHFILPTTDLRVCLLSQRCLDQVQRDSHAARVCYNTRTPPPSPPPLSVMTPIGSDYQPPRLTISSSVIHCGMQADPNKSEPNFTWGRDPDDPGKGWNLFHKCDFLESDVCGFGAQPMTVTGPAKDPTFTGNHYVLFAVVNLRTVSWLAVGDIVNAEGDAKILRMDSSTSASKSSKAVMERLIEAIRQLLAYNAAQRFGVPFAQTIKIAQEIKSIEVRH